MWVYKPNDLDVNTFDVGYIVEGTFKRQETYNSLDEAAARVNYLNGGTQVVIQPGLVEPKELGQPFIGKGEYQ